MANHLYDDWESLVAGVRSVVPIMLENDIAERAKHILRAHIGKDVYGAYKPKMNGWAEQGSDGKWRKTTYKRRGQLAFNVFAKLESPSTLVISSSTPPAPPIRRGYTSGDGENGGLLRLLEGNRHGIWRGGFPRPAVKNAQRTFFSDAGLRSAIKKSIKNRIG